MGEPSDPSDEETIHARPRDWPSTPSATPHGGFRKRQPAPPGSGRAARECASSRRQRHIHASRLALGEIAGATRGVPAVVMPRRLMGATADTVLGGGLACDLPQRPATRERSAAAACPPDDRAWPSANAPAQVKRPTLPSGRRSFPATDTTTPWKGRHAQQEANRRARGGHIGRYCCFRG